MKKSLQHVSIYKVFGLLGILFLLFKYFHARYHFNLHFVAYFTYAMYACFAAFGVYTKNHFLNKILIFGIVAGIVELVSDWWLVDVKLSLFYPLNEPLLWASPRYMPVAWAVIFVQIGSASLFAFEKWNFNWSVFTALALGAIFVPFFEYWAKQEGWWKYQGCKMIFGAVPYYIILSEALVGVVIPFWVRSIEKKGYGFAILGGAIQGLWIWITCIFAYYLTC